MKSNYGKTVLNGNWDMSYLGSEPYDSTAEPLFCGCVIKDAVPAYFEDLRIKFKETDFFTRLKINPLYTDDQRYPQTGYVSDMALPNYLGTFVYARSFTLSDTDGEPTLYIGGVQNSIYAWINGTFIGRHNGYSSEFFIDVPKGILRRGENRITLAVSNNRLSGYMGRPVSGCTSRAANECTGGIYGDVELRLYKNKIRDFWITVAEDLKSFRVNIDNAADRAYRIEIYSDAKKILKSATIAPGECSVQISTDGLSLWSLESPIRYTVTISEGEHSISRRFGIRRLSSREGKLYFNGNPFYPRGICEHCYYPISVHPTRDISYYRNVIKKIKALGFNLIHFHTSVPMAKYVEAADELGILMEIETPNNTTYSEWRDIIAYTHRYTAPAIYSSGNEMVIDEDYIEHLRMCADLVHKETDSLFSPMSAMRGIEYHSYGDLRVEDPFPHNPVRLRALDEFSDVYNSYSLGTLSYESEGADPALLDYRNSIYKKPILSHEICINGTYCDLSLERRYENTRIGETALLSSVREHLSEKGLIDRAELFYKNSSEWQRRLRKFTFEAARRAESIAGYDYLGDIDHHWHTFGYCVGMMNEFYELKPGETVQNVLRYNSDAVLLADLPHCVSFYEGDEVDFPILISNYGKTLNNANLCLQIKSKSDFFFCEEIKCGDIPSGKITSLYNLKYIFPHVERPCELKLTASLSSGKVTIENEWEIFLFPKVKEKERTKETATVTNDISAEELIEKMKNGETVLLFGSGPFSSAETSFQIALAGRTTGHLATVIRDSDITSRLPHNGFCSWQFREMLNGAHSVILDIPTIPFSPIIEIASTYKNARREALMFEYKIENGKLFVCSLNLGDNDPCAKYLKHLVLEYVGSEGFDPRDSLSLEELKELCKEKTSLKSKNENSAQNKNDITMQ